MRQFVRILLKFADRCVAVPLAGVCAVMVTGVKPSRRSGSFGTSPRRPMVVIYGCNAQARRSALSQDVHLPNEV